MATTKERECSADTCPIFPTCEDRESMQQKQAAEKKAAPNDTRTPKEEPK